MKKLGILALALALLVGASVSAETKGINLSGEIELDSVLTVNTTDVSNDNSDTRAFVHPEITLNVAADLTNNVSALVQLENRQQAVANQQLIGTAKSRVGFDVDEFALGVEQAYIEAKEAFRRELSFKLGIFDVAYDLRGNGDCFLLDLPNAALTTDNAVGGWMARWEWNQTPCILDVFMLTIADTGLEDSNSDLYGMVVDYEKDKNLFRFMVLYNRDQSGLLSTAGAAADSSFVTVGIGGDYWVLEQLEVYGEIAWQGGTHWDAPAGATTIDHSAMAGYLGLRYDFNVTYKPFVDLSAWYFQGSDPTDVASDVDQWYFMGSLDNTVVFEETAYGLAQNVGLGAAANRGYMTIGLEGGLNPTENTFVSLRYNWLTATEDFSAANNATDLGNEIDIKASYNYTSDLKISLNAGILLPGDALTLAYTGGTTNDDMILLVNLDTTLKF